MNIRVYLFCGSQNNFWNDRVGILGSTPRSEVGVLNNLLLLVDAPFPSFCTSACTVREKELKSCFKHG